MPAVSSGSALLAICPITISSRSACVSVGPCEYRSPTVPAKRSPPLGAPPSPPAGYPALIMKYGDPPRPASRSGMTVVAATLSEPPVPGQVDDQQPYQIR